MKILTEQMTLSDDFWYNALPVGAFFDPRHGLINITPELIKNLEENRYNAPTYTPPVKIGHGDGAPSPGIVEDMEARDDGLYVRVKVDDETIKAIKDGKYRYMSSEYSSDYMDKKTGKRIGPTFLGIALVNQPGHPGVQPIALSDGEWKQAGNEPEDKDKGDTGMTPEEIKALQAKLAETEKKLSDETEAKTKLKEEAEKVKTLADQSAAEVLRLQKEKHETEVKAFCDSWTEKGIAPAVVDKIKPVLLAEGGQVIKLGDDSSTDIKTLLGDIFEAIPKVTLKTLGDPQAENNGFDPVKLGDDIAGCVNMDEKKD